MFFNPSKRFRLLWTFQNGTKNIKRWREKVKTLGDIKKVPGCVTLIHVSCLTTCHRLPCQLLREFLLVTITCRATIQVFLEEPGAFSWCKTSLQVISLSASWHLTERGTQKFLQCLTSGRVSYGWVKSHLSSLRTTDHHINIHTSSPHYEFETLLGSKLETGPCTTRRRTIGEWLCNFPSWAPLTAHMLLLSCISNNIKSFKPSSSSPVLLHWALQNTLSICKAN